MTPKRIETIIFGVLNKEQSLQKLATATNQSTHTIFFSITQKDSSLFAHWVTAWVIHDYCYRFILKQVLAFSVFRRGSCLLFFLNFFKASNYIALLLLLLFIISFTWRYYIVYFQLGLSNILIKDKNIFWLKAAYNMPLCPFLDLADSENFTAPSCSFFIYITYIYHISVQPISRMPHLVVFIKITKALYSKHI